jgi:hypothetical protein
MWSVHAPEALSPCTHWSGGQVNPFFGWAVWKGFFVHLPEVETQMLHRAACSAVTTLTELRQLLPVCMIRNCPKNFIFWCVSGRKYTSWLYKTAGKMICLNGAQNQVSYIKRPRYIYPDTEHKTDPSVVHSREIPVTTFHLNYWNFFFFFGHG